MAIIDVSTQVSMTYKLRTAVLKIKKYKCVE